MPRTEDFNRDQVLDKAKNAFWLKGYNGTSMQDLVDATGLNRSSIYNSFGSKMELFQESLKQYQNESSAIFDKAKQQERTAIETIGLIFVYTLEHILSDQERKGCMLINCHTEMGNQDEQLEDLFSANRDRLVATFEDLVKQGQADGSIRNTEKSNLLAHYLVNAFQGFRITGMNTTDPRVLKSIIQNILKTIT
jgi:TetR/AcrR family transcriptional repressor of nem operon